MPEYNVFNTMDRLVILESRECLMRDRINKLENNMLILENVIKEIDELLTHISKILNFE